MAKISLRLFFRRIEVEEQQAVPDGPILLVSNHTNALIDPLLPLIVLPRRVTLTGKNVLNKNPLLALLTWCLGSIPFHRAEDVGKGADPRQNVRSMQRCREVLAGGGAICIFPEGISHSDRQMREFHGGAARIVRDFVRKDGNPGNLKIVPMGILYTAKDRFRSTVWVRFGPAIDAGTWTAEHPDASPEKLTEELRRRIEDLTIGYHDRREMLIVNWANAMLATSEQIHVLGTPEPPVAESFSRLARLQSGYRTSRGARAAEVDALSDRVREYSVELKRRGIGPGEVFLPMDTFRVVLFLMRELELIVIGAPLALWGMMNHLLPYLLVRKIARLLSRDKDHWATNVVYPSFVVFPFFYFLQLAAAWIFLPHVWAALYTVALPYTGYYAILYNERVGNAWRRASTFIYLLAKPQIRRRLTGEGRAILAGIYVLAAHLQTESKTA